MDAKKILQKIIHNWPAKVLSIALALIIFMFHRMSTTTTRVISVPLAIETSATLVPASSYPQAVRVQLRGEDDGIRAITDGDIEAFVDFTRHGVEGVYRAPVQIRTRGSAVGVEPLEITVNPAEVSVRLDMKISVTLPLVPEIRGRVPSGFDLVSHTINPAHIVVSGPKSILDDLSEIRTEPIDLDGRAGDFNIEVNIARTSPFFTVMGSGIAEVHGQIRPSLPVRNFDGIPITVIGLTPGLHAEIGGRTGSVRLGGSQSLLDAFRPTPLFLTVDLSGLSEPGTYTLPVAVDLPDGFLLIRREPEELNVFISAIILEEY